MNTEAARAAVHGFAAGYQRAKTAAQESGGEPAGVFEQVVSGLAIGLLAVGIGYGLGAQRRNADGSFDSWGPLIGAAQWGGGAAACGVTVAILSKSYRPIGLATTAGSVGGFVAAGSVWKRKFVPTVLRPNTLGA